ncbi:MAG: hypothetical protein CL678_18495 [Bdellovibrionaceae bacterium]|nr:hypothetical protein [Pseudobdellovibrionaceae bacterium]
MFSLGSYAQVEIPSLTSPVIDQAGMLTSEFSQRLRGILYQLKNEKGTQVVVLTIPSLDGESIEGFSIRVVDQWKLGSEKKDDGVLLLISRGDRKLRIEVGQGLEGILTDLKSKRIIDYDITPFFKAGDIEGGVLNGVLSIIKTVQPDYHPGIRAPQPRKRRSRGGIFSHLFVLILIFFLLFTRLGRTILYMRGGSHRGRFGGGGGFGGGFGGGGFGGGGGGFSGGGASGGW